MSDSASPRWPFSCHRSVTKTGKQHNAPCCCVHRLSLAIRAQVLLIQHTHSLIRDCMFSSTDVLLPIFWRHGCWAIRANGILVTETSMSKTKSMSATVAQIGNRRFSLAHKTWHEIIYKVLLLENTANPPASVEVLYNRSYTEQMGPSLREAVICSSSKTMGVKGER